MTARIERVEVVQAGYDTARVAGTARAKTRKLVQYVVKFPPEAQRSDKYFDRKRDALAYLAEQ